MYKPFIKNLVASLFIASSLATSFQTFATKDDANQSITIKSKRQASDLKNKIASYLDDVYIQRGTLTIKADLVQVFSEEGSDEEVYLAKGKPAIFEQTLSDGKPINLSAEQIKYEPNKHIITISGNAKVSQNGSLVNGETIIYNTLTEQLLAESKAEERVTTILQPDTNGKN